jgi:eukaryotic-like serine/threonine-protein kinase
MTDRLSTATAQIGRYQITGELGRGGMGIVYRGKDPLIGREVAIKTLTEVTPELRERFYLEARSGILSHPNIVTVYELGEHEGSPFIAMEYIAGESLEKMLRRLGRLSVLEAVSIVEQLCAGLGHAHGNGVVHRDIKPANVLVQPDGRVTIVDFGIARLADQSRRLTRTDALLGTFHYIAPERLKGETSDNRADIWSTGVMFYEMLTGELPFNGKDISALYQVIHEPYTPLQDFVEDLPPGLSDVVQKALEKRVEDRYETAEGMALDLQVVSNALKEDHVKALLETARRLAAERQFVNARTILLRAQRSDPGNLHTRALIDEVQGHLSEMQRGDQLRQILEQAQVALAERRWDDAIAEFQRARQMDTENRFGIDEHLRQAQEQKRQQQKVALLWEQAREARGRGDLTGARDFMGQALEIDEHSTDLRNAYSLILRDIRRRQAALHVDELLRAARDHYASRQYTEAIARLREAAEIDPSHAEVQQLLFTVATQQKDARRQELLERIAKEIQELVDRDDFALAQDRVRRALESLPGEGLLVRLKVEIDSKKRSFDTHQAVRAAMLKAQELFVDHPEQALQAIRNGLEQAPGNETLLQSGARLEEHLKGNAVNAARKEALLRAHVALETEKYGEAQRVLEEAIRKLGSNEDFEHLLALTNRGQAEQEQKSAEVRDASTIPKETRALSAFAGPALPPASATSKQESKQAFRAKAASVFRNAPRWSRPDLALVLGGAIVLAALAIALPFALRHHEAPATNTAVLARVPAQVPTYMEINASPWARVLRVQNADGKNILLPDDGATPLRLDDLKPGQFMVILAGPNGDRQILNCSISIKNHLCTLQIEAPDIKQVMMGANP